jgi:ATP-binding cassette, subfamily B, bacterial MsbA
MSSQRRRGNDRFNIHQTRQQAMLQKLMDSLTPWRRDSVLARLFRESFRAHAGLYGISIGCMLVIAGMTTASAWIMRDVTNATIIDRDFNRVLVISAVIAAIFITKGFATYFQVVFLSRAGNRIIASQQMKIYHRLIDQDVSYFNSNASSDLIIRLTHNAQAARSVIDTIVTGFARDLLTLIGLLSVMIYQQPYVAIAVFFVAPIAFLAVRHLLKKVKELFEQELASLGMIVKIMQETTIGIRIIKSFSLEHLMTQRLEEAVRSVEERANAMVRLEAATSPIMETLGGLMIAGMLLLSAFLVLKGNTTPGELMSFLTATLLAYEPAKRLARMRVSIEAGLIGVRMMFEIMDRPLTMIEKENAPDLAAGPGQIALDSVDFGYVEGVRVIDGMSHVFPAKRTTALVGPSGGGKSTIVSLVMRMIDPQQGTVTIDGTDLRSVSFRSIRERIAFVGQETFLFSGSVAHNIALGRPDADRAAIIEAAKAAQAHDFIMAMPKGYDSQVGENGNRLSGGQKQRLAIARAILKDSEILILDEATSALDAHSEASVREALAAASRNRTTIIIAHRLSTIAAADFIAYVDGGRIIETGSPRDLLAVDGPFRRLHDRQSLGDRLDAAASGSDTLDAA